MAKCSKYPFINVRTLSNDIGVCFQTVKNTILYTLFKHNVQLQKEKKIAIPVNVNISSFFRFSNFDVTSIITA